ncbi:FAD-dependent monooxygenase [Amycolatopsis sp. NPDC059027]|uniref:FAD-dependent monooxygenase n=1 Tax=unclassified Amycolatopsis TaxID=2618356 RepID=UPI00366BBC38
MTTTVLVSGAGIAGPAAAYWLHHHGFTVTVVETAPALRPGGQAVDFRGAQMELLRRMGILDEVRRHETAMDTETILDLEGNPAIEVPTSFMSGEVEILRGDLSRILYERTRDYAEYVFGDRVTSLIEQAEGVDVTFASGRTRTFDLVVGADGVHSGVRAAAFGPEAGFRRDSGFQIAGYTVPNHLGLDHAGLTYNEPGLGVRVTSARDPEQMQVGLVFAGDGPGRCGAEQQKRFLAEKYAGMGWEMPKLLDALDSATDLYFDSISQIHLDRWSKGRVVLLGDAAWCAGPGGNGTGLGMMGAHVLAGELAAAGGDHRTAFARYEEKIRPAAKLGQRNGGGSGTFLAPLTEKKIRQRNRIYRMMTNRLLAGLFDKFTSKAANMVRCQDYPSPVAA